VHSLALARLGQLTDQQVTPTRRRLGFVHNPETPTEILGREVDFLRTIDKLVVNYSEIFNVEHFAANKEALTMHLSVLLNGVEVGSISGSDPNGTLTTGQAILDVSQLFSEIPKKYAAKVSR
jgi:hypothetical protein